MKRSVYGWLVCAACVSLGLIGCSKETDNESIAAEPAATAVDPTASAKAADLLKQAETALQTKEFDKAAQLILEVQREGAKLSGAQTSAAARLMQDLQAVLGDEIAKGNAKAKAAVDILRRSSSGR